MNYYVLWDVVCLMTQPDLQTQYISKVVAIRFIRLNGCKSTFSLYSTAQFDPCHPILS